MEVLYGILYHKGAIHNFYVNGTSYLTISSTAVNINNPISLLNNVWHYTSGDGISRFYYDSNGCSYFHSGNTGSTNGFIFRNTAQSDILTINDAGNISMPGSFTCSTDIYANTFITSTQYNNNIILKTFQLLPALAGSGGYYLIDVYQYALGGYSYLNLSVSSTNFYWLGRVFVVSTSGIYFTNDWYNACSTGALSSYGRLCISITPSTAPATGQLMNVRIIG